MTRKGEGWIRPVVRSFDGLHDNVFEDEGGLKNEHKD